MIIQFPPFSRNLTQLFPFPVHAQFQIVRFWLPWFDGEKVQPLAAFLFSISDQFLSSHSSIPGLFSAHSLLSLTFLLSRALSLLLNSAHSMSFSSSSSFTFFELAWNPLHCLRRMCKVAARPTDISHRILCCSIHSVVRVSLSQSCRIENSVVERVAISATDWRKKIESPIPKVHGVWNRRKQG
jgi:hypothetical protein